MVNDIKTHKISYCKQCGIEVHRSSELCPKCAAVLRRVVERPSRDKLKELIKTRSFLSIANEFHVSDGSIRKWCKAYNLPFRKSDINQISDEEWQTV